MIRVEGEVRLLQEFGRSFITKGPLGKVFQQLMLGTKSGSRRSPDEVYLQPESWAESVSRRSPDAVCLATVGVEDEARLP